MLRLSVLLVLAAGAVAADGPVVVAGRVELPGLLVRPRLNGLVAKVLVKEGQAVKKGEVLAELDAELVKLEVEVAEAKLKQSEVEAGFARAELDRQGALAATPREKDQAKALAEVKDAEVVVAKATLTKARLGLAGTKLLSPADAQVDRVLLPAGSVARADQDAVVRLTPAADPVVVFAVGEDEYQRLREKAAEGKAAMTAAAGFVGEAGHPHPLVLLPNPVFHPEGKTVTVRATLAAPKEGLAQGEPVRVELGVGKK